MANWITTNVPDNFYILETVNSDKGIKSDYIIIECLYY